MIFVQNDNIDPYFNHALEEYLLENFRDEVFILWRNRSSILIGRNQNTYSEINSDFVNKNQIDIVRRLSGGGTVFCDLGNINFTFITNIEDDQDNHGFEKFALPVVKALHDLDIKGEFSGRNDIIVEGRKISGNAQYRSKRRLLHHGTLLFSGDLSLLTGALIPNPLKFIDKSVKSVASRVGNIVDYLNEPMDVLEFKDYLKNKIMNEYHIIREYQLSDEDVIEINKIMNQRFLSWDWNYGASPKYTYLNKKKYEIGIIEYSLNVEKGVIIGGALNGDFFGEKSANELVDILVGTKHEKLNIEKVLKHVKIDDYIQGLDQEAFVLGLIENKG